MFFVGREAKNPPYQSLDNKKIIFFMDLCALAVQKYFINGLLLYSQYVYAKCPLCLKIGCMNYFVSSPRPSRYFYSETSQEAIPK